MVSDTSSPIFPSTCSSPQQGTIAITIPQQLNKTLMPLLRATARRVDNRNRNDDNKQHQQNDGTIMEW
jgi:hypothetical protein